MRISTTSLNRGAVVADQADVLHWRDVNDALPYFNAAFSRICHEIDAVGNIDDRGLGFAASHAQAQLTPPSTAGAKPKPVTTVPIRPALQTPADTANAMGQAERLALQSDLAWVGQYNGAITGRRQRAHGRRDQGISEGPRRQADRRAQSAGARRAGRDRPAKAGERRLEDRQTDPGTGARLGIPTKLVPQQASDANGTKWTSPTGTIQIQLARRKEAGPTTAKLAEQEKKEPPDARSTTPWSSRTSSCCRACRA